MIIDPKVYKEYSVLPKLTRLGSDATVFIKDSNYDYYLAEKKKAIRSGQKSSLIDHNSGGLTDKILETLKDFICEKAPWVVAESFFDCALQLQEDISIHMIYPDRDWLAYTNICFPSGWNPEDAIGKDFATMHKSVPGMKLGNSDKILHAMLFNGPYERFNWGPVFEPWEQQKINYHPRLPRVNFNPDDPHVHIKVERQVIWGFPQLNAVLFTMRQFLVPFEEIDVDSLHLACYNMTEEQRKYKNVSQEFLDWIKYAF